MSNFFAQIEPIKPIKFMDQNVKKADEKKASIPFENLLKNAISNYETQQEATEQDGNILAVGETDNLAKIQIDSMKAKAALSTTVQLTSKVVSAYKEIMQIQL